MYRSYWLVPDELGIELLRVAESAIVIIILILLLIIHFVNDLILSIIV